MFLCLYLPALNRSTLEPGKNEERHNRKHDNDSDNDDDERLHGAAFLIGRSHAGASRPTAGVCPLLLRAKRQSVGSGGKQALPAFTINFEGRLFLSGLCVGVVGANMVDPVVVCVFG